ncbi:GUN4 domain-containing protein [Iningainema sp. BLCCT55]|uniref:GUN4 domain-containing protein n=2 Tax=Iningainema TaxID=1932705 RepID=A0A8J7CH05_9CYAN|nr:GUN4 domain-containing protein [Iningainema tapete BLCC-T55]
MWKLGIAQTQIVPIPTFKSSFDESQNDRAPDLRPSEIVEPPQMDLLSDLAIDYTRLRELLAARNWFDADNETYLVMLKVVGRENGDWIRDKELLNFKSTDLRTIDSLWVKYSNGRFGFSVQKKISLEVSGVPDGKWSEQAWEKFGDRVGWRMNGSWISHNQITFDTRAPVGHLPVCGVLALGFLSHCHFGILLSRPDL